MKPRPKAIGEKVELLGLFNQVSPEEMESVRVEVLKHFESAADHNYEETVEAAGGNPAAPTPQRPKWLYATAIAAAIAIVIFIPTALNHRAPAVFEDASGSRRIAFDEVVRVSDVAGSTLVLADSSRVEMRAQAELVLERADDGVRIRLNKGSVIVNAAKQHGHLYVQTKDVTVSVVGTVFLVNADDKGSRVAVIEGEVRVQQGTVEKSLRPGEQLASNPKSEDRKFFLETGWSREAYAYLSKLHESMAQSLAARQSQSGTTSVSDKPKFEEASIRLCEKDLPAAEGQGRGGGGSGSFRLSPGRVDALCMTVPTLINMAHRSLNNNPFAEGTNINLPMNATFTSPPEDGTRVRGGPDWVRSEKYTVAAVGDSTDGPTLQGPMLLDLLGRRFKLKLRVETEEISVYALTIAKGGLKIKPIEIESVKYEELRKLRASLNPGLRGRSQLERDPTYVGLMGCSYPPLGVPNLNAVEYGQFREALRRDGKPPLCGFSNYGNGPNRVISSGASSISELVDSLKENATRSYLSDTLNGLLVVDKTGLPDTNCLIEIPSAGTRCAPLFNFVMEFAADESFFTRTGATPQGRGMDFSLPKAPNVFNALEKLGLHLEKSKAPREFIVIEHIERLSPN
jgi:uncharacterized protein (TIGR03435 family)